MPSCCPRCSGSPAPGASAPSGSASGSISGSADVKSDNKAGSSESKTTVTDTNRDSGGGLASPRSESVTRTTFFGLSPTAAIIVSVAVLLVVILAIVAMTNSGGTTYIDKGDRRL